MKRPEDKAYKFGSQHLRTGAVQRSGGPGRWASLHHHDAHLWGETEGGASEIQNEEFVSDTWTGRVSFLGSLKTCV